MHKKQHQSLDLPHQKSDPTPSSSAFISAISLSNRQLNNHYSYLQPCHYYYTQQQQQQQQQQKQKQKQKQQKQQQKQTIYMSRKRTRLNSISLANSHNSFARSRRNLNPFHKSLTLDTFHQPKTFISTFNNTLFHDILAMSANDDDHAGNTNSDLNSASASSAPAFLNEEQDPEELYDLDNAPVSLSMDDSFLPSIYKDVSWQTIENYVDVLANAVRSYPIKFKIILAITRGGLIPAALLAEKLSIRNVLTATTMFYSDTGSRFYGLQQPQVLQFPDSQLLTGRDVLVVDDVWDTGCTAMMIKRRCEVVGAKPQVCTLIFKKEMNEFPGQAPEFYAAVESDWIVFPWDKISPGIQNKTQGQEQGHSHDNIPAQSS